MTAPPDAIGNLGVPPELPSCTNPHEVSVMMLTHWVPKAPVPVWVPLPKVAAK